MSNFQKKYFTSPHLTQKKQKMSRKSRKTIKKIKKNIKKREREREPPGGHPPGGARRAPPLSLFLFLFSYLDVFKGFLLLLGCFGLFFIVVGLFWEIFWLFWVR